MTSSINTPEVDSNQIDALKKHRNSDVITVVRDPKHTLGKQFSKNPDGTVSKKSAVSVSFGLAVMHHIKTHEDLVKLLQEVGDDPNAAIINSGFDGIEFGEEFIILSGREIETRLGIPRTDREKQKGVHTIIHEGKTYKAIGRFKQNVYPSSWQFFDRDNDKHTPPQFTSLNHEEWLAEVNAICPGLIDAAYCHVGSTSSRVLLDGKPVNVGNGHTWVKFKNPADVERFRTAVIVAAVKAGKTWLKPGFSKKEPGKVVSQSLTTILDPSVFTPGRLIFIGKPDVNEGLTVEPLSAGVHLGQNDTFDSTVVELPDSDVIREMTRKAGVEMEVTEDSNGLRIKIEDLTLDAEIETANFGILTIRELVERGIENKIRIQSPFRDSSSFAAFLSTGKGGKPFVHDTGTSTSHWLIEAEAKECQVVAATGLIKRVLLKAPDDCGAPFEPDAVEALRVIQNAKPADFQRIRSQFKKANKGISVVNLDKAIKSATASDIAIIAQTHHGYASDVISRFTINGWPPVGFEGDLYRNDPVTNLWVPVPFDEIVHQVTTKHDAKDNCKRGSDYKAIAQHVISIVTNDEFFRDVPDGLATPGGFYQIIDGKIEVVPLTPAHRQRVMIDVTPIEMLTPMFDAFLHETFQSNTSGEEDQQITLVQEISGSIMTGVAHKFQKAIKYYDPFGRAGKGTLVKPQEALVPLPFRSAVSPFRWDGEYFLANLAGSRLNVVGELPDDKPIPAAAFKTVLGGDSLTGRHPTHRPFTFKNQAAQLFMTNHLINTTDHSEAFFARWIIVEFPNSLLVSGRPIDPDLAERIMAAEMPGIALWALKGAARLLTNGAYSKSSAHDRLMSQWRRRTNSLDEFLFESCDLGEGYLVNRATLYHGYTVWAKDSGRKPFSKSKVKELLEHNMVHGIRHSVLDGDEVFRGVRIKQSVVKQLKKNEFFSLDGIGQPPAAPSTDANQVGEVDF